jgi:hypothetical protein
MSEEVLNVAVLEAGQESLKNHGTPVHPGEFS